MIRITSRGSHRDGLEAFIRELPALRTDYAEHVAQQVAERWRAQVHVITGAYKASIYVSTPTYSEYASAASQAALLNHDAQIAPPLPTPPAGMAVVSSAVAYSAQEELGTSSRPGHPAFVPAVESVRASMPALQQARRGRRRR